MPNTSDTPLLLETGTDLLIMLLYSPGKSGTNNEHVDGITRLQKLIFLLRQGIGPSELVKLASSYGYKPYKMGPYSNELKSDIDELISAGIIRTERLQYWIKDDSDSYSRDVDVYNASTKKKGVESQRFSLTEGLGTIIGKDLWKEARIKDKRELVKFKAFFNTLTLRQLLIFAYERFPDFTTQSEIREQLGLSG